MINFFKHKKFWLPLVILLLLFLMTEWFLRLGWYDRWVKPRSFLGESLKRELAINQVGKNQINWITVGDSRIDWGIDHAKLADFQRQQGFEHIRMSFGSARFPAMQASIDWSLQNLPNLDGVMLGITENDLAHFAQLDNQYKVAWPFKDHFDFEQYQPLYLQQNNHPLWYHLAWFSYLDDIKSFINNPLKRRNELKHQGDSLQVLSFKKDKASNLCAHPLKTIQQCIASTKKINHKIPQNSGFRVVKKVCGTPGTRVRAKVNHPVPKQTRHLTLISNWTGLIKNVLKNDKQFTLVLLPEHETHDYVIKPSNADEITQNIIKQVKNRQGFNLIDLRDLFNDKEDCEYFSDPSHFNNQGIELVTQALIAQLAKTE